DDSLAWLAENFPQIKTIALDKNYGFTGGYNRALEQIKAEYYLLINSDIEVEDGWLEPLEAWMDDHPKCGACAPKLLSYSDRSRFEYAGAAGGLIDRYGYPFCRGRVPGRTERDSGQYDSPADVFWVSGACMMVRAELFTRLGGFDERFFAHQEEIDLCWRLQLEGYKVTVVPRSKVYHLGGGTLPNDSPWKLELNYRNNLLMLSNNLARTYALEYYNKYKSKHAGKPTGKNAASAEKAARRGDRKARKTIFTRMVLDGFSAAAYLLSFRPKCFAAVCKAHRQYRQLKNDSGKLTDTYNYIVRTNGSATLAGIFPKWIVWQAFIRGRNIFDYLRKKL
ncbi:MAG: glycosyltransferase family 2 protein, partial [Bacteroidales bacterium]|nr:glycosyltransferase family 2 protein [Bacteroidales bacterium]